MLSWLRDFVKKRSWLRGPAVRVRSASRRLLGRPDEPSRTAVPWGHLDDHVRQFDLRLPPAPDGRSRLPSVRVVAPARCLVPAALERGGLGGFEPDSVATFLAMCDLARPGAVFDIGANTGHYSMLARIYSSREVVAFEPVPELARVARSLGSSNGIPFTVEELALSDAPGMATFYLSDGSDSSSSLKAGFRRSRTQIDVTKQTLDGYVAATGLLPAVLKIDTETTEPDVIRGGLRTLADQRPWFICEVLPNRGGDVEIQKLLEPLGYLFYRVGRVPTEPSAELIGEPSQYNWLFAPELATQELWDSVRSWRTVLTAHKQR